MVAAIETAAQGVLDARAKFLTPLGPPLSGGMKEAPPLTKAVAMLANTGGELSEGVKEAPPLTRGGGGGVCTLADLYDPLTMPPELVKAHHALDRAVDAAYVSTEPGRSGKPFFKTEAERVAFLFERYQQLTAPLVAQTPRRKRKR